MKLLEGNQAQKRLHSKTQSKPSFTGSPIEERKSSETHETRLEIERAVKGTVGSNPTPSAIFSLEIFAALKIRKNEGSLGAHSQRIRFHDTQICTY
jgi:hypothetical protein